VPLFVQIENKNKDLERDIELLKLELEGFDKRLADMRTARMKAEAELANGNGQVRLGCPDCFRFTILSARWTHS